MAVANGERRRDWPMVVVGSLTAFLTVVAVVMWATTWMLP